MDATTADTPGAHQLGPRLLAAWRDQEAFNLELRPKAKTFEGKSEQTHDMTLHLVAECFELLEETHWKKHRRPNGPPNLGQIREEIADIFKMFVTVAQIWDVTPDELLALYWDKSAVVRQRHAEEWLRRQDRPCVVVDLDNTLADFSVGMAVWLMDRGYIDAHTRKRLIEDRPWIDGEAAGIADRARWSEIKHEFYTFGGFRTLPPVAGFKEFMDWIAAKGWMTVILTSRSIDRYPNILTDTVWWLEHFGIRADFIWWGSDKSGKLADRAVLEHVLFAVDDDVHFVRQLSKAHVKTFWVNKGGPIDADPLHVKRVPDLAAIIKEVDPYGVL
jgi:NTP pyrophosphatase (non-canonical NTP hydrolase)